MKLSFPAAVVRRTALFAAALLVAAFVVVSPAAAGAASASNSSAASALFTRVNIDRIGIPVVKLKLNRYLTAYAQNHAKKAATCASCQFVVHDLAPQNPDSHVWDTFQVSGSSTSSRVNKAMQYLLDHYKTVMEGAAWNFGAIGWYEKGSKAYVTFAGAQYSALPYDSIGTVTLPSHPVVGKVITPRISGFSPVPTSFDYLWRAGPYTVPGATTITPGAVTIGATWTLTLVAHRAGYGSPTITATTAHKVVAGTIRAPKHELVLGNRNVNQGIGTASTGWVVPTGVTWTFTWYRNDRVIPGITTSFYNFTPADLGKRVDVKVVASATGYRSASIRTHTKKKVGKPLLLFTTFPTITGSAIVGSQINVGLPHFTVAPTTMSVQWYANGHKIHGATGMSYRIAGAEAGKKLTYTLLAKKPGYATTTVASSPTVPIARGTIQVVEGVSLTGNETVGQKVSASKGEYNPSSVSVSYQWYSGTHKISGATHSSRVVKASDLVGELLLKITVKKTGYSTLSGYYSE